MEERVRIYSISSTTILSSINTVLGGEEEGAVYFCQDNITVVS